MMLLTHAIFSLLCSLLATELLGIENKLLFIVIAVATAMVVDIDNIRSSIGQKLEPYARALNFLFKHRGLLHSIWPPLLLFLLLININKIMAIAVVVGYLSHLILDSLTIEGISLFWPIKYKIKGFVRVGGITEQVIIVLTFLALVYIVII